MKKLIIASLVLGVIFVSLGAAGLVYAQTQIPEEPPFTGWRNGMFADGERPYARTHGMMGAFRVEGGEAGMRGGYRLGTPGLMHEYMLEAFADALGLTGEQVQERMIAGETRWEIALSEGFSEEDIPGLFQSVHATALQEMVIDGVISQEQADQMLERMAQRYAAGFGPGDCHGEGLQGRFGGGRGQWGN
jgi:hypothetical protein